MSERLQQALAELVEISKRETSKTATMWVQPMDEGWSYELHFSSEELAATHALTDEIASLMNFRVTFPLFRYRHPSLKTDDEENAFDFGLPERAHVESRFRVRTAKAIKTES